jgi:hypothetical protein
MDETKFWAMIESAWAKTGGWNESRTRLLAGEEVDSNELMEAAQEMIPHLEAALKSLNQDELLAFDRIAERKLYDIDREEIQEFTDGSDDGFLYCRGFILAAGQAYYDEVNANPSRAMMNAECEDFCYLALHLYEDIFEAIPHSGISRESRRNPAGWKAN